MQPARSQSGFCDHDNEHLDSLNVRNLFRITGSLTLLPSSDIPSNAHVRDQICYLLKLDGGEAHTVTSLLSGAGVFRRIMSTVTPQTRTTVHLIWDLWSSRNN